VSAHAQTIASNRRLGDLAPRLFGVAAAIGVIGLLVSVIIAFTGAGWDRFLRSYLTAFMFVLSICLGGLFFTILHHCVRAGWSVVLRRIAETIAANLMWIWVLFIPIAIGMFNSGIDEHGVRHGLYDWVNPHFEHLSDKYNFWLTPGPWLVRAIIYMAVWAFLSWFFFSHSTAQDKDGDVRHSLRMETFCYPAAILYAITQSFAAMDWVMSMESQWFSTMFVVYYFAASCCGYFAVQILTIFFLQRRGRLTSEITLEHYQDAGKLLFAFGIVFWAYIGFSQYMLIWYAGIPEETGWYLTRQMSGWFWVSLALLFGHFAAPFVGIISKHPKRMKHIIALAAGWMLLLHFIDVYWLVMPQVPDEQIATATSYAQIGREAAEDPSMVGYGWHLLDITCLVGLVGLLAAGTFRRLGSVALIPEQDPRLHESLAFENI